MAKIYSFIRNDKMASQGEVSSLQVSENSIAVRGYQRFKVDATELSAKDHNISKKEIIIKPILLSLSKEFSSFMDIGCCNGYFCFLCHLLGYKKIMAVDHDEGYIQIVETIREHFSFNTIETIVSKFIDLQKTSEVVLAAGLVHWIYSCTELIGSLDEIARRFSVITEKVLLVEWIDGQDEAVRGFKHIGFNADIHKDSYKRENFVASLKKYFSSVESVGKARLTREMFLARR